jgi:hypothetical protein
MTFCAATRDFARADDTKKHWRRCSPPDSGSGNLTSVSTRVWAEHLVRPFLPRRSCATDPKLNGYAIEPEQNSGTTAFSITIVAGDHREDEKEAIPAGVVRSVPKKLSKP